MCQTIRLNLYKRNSFAYRVINRIGHEYFHFFGTLNLEKRAETTAILLLSLANFGPQNITSPNFSNSVKKLCLF